MLVDRNTQIKVEGFQKYASFVSDKFGVEVRMDGTRAETDGKTIFIPNIAGMQDKEIDFLRCVLLHEIGHIKYTPFTKESRKNLKSNAHFDIWNAVEDARIENCLMKDFDGAHDILSRLYNDYMKDQRFMNRVFGGTLKDSDETHLVLCYIHDMLIKLDEKFSFMRVINKHKVHTVKTFIKKNKIEKLIADAPFKTAEDAIALANKLYDIIYKTKKDISGSMDIEAIQKMIDKALGNDVPEMEKKAKELQKKLDKMVADIQKEQRVLEGKQNDYNKFRKTIRPELNEIRKEQQKLVEAIKAKKKRDAKEKKIKSAKNAVIKREHKVSKEQDKIDEMTVELNDLEENSLKANKLKDKMRKASERKEKHFPAIRKLKEKVAKYEKELAKAEKTISKLPDNVASQSRKELINKYKDNINRKEQLREKLEGLSNDVKQQENAINDMAQEYHDTKGEAGKQIAQQMKALEDNLHKNGVPSKIMPEFEKNDSWSKADKEQEKFDRRASSETGDVITNGAGFSKQDTRDILALIDKTKNDLEEIDLVRHFDDSHSDSKLDSFNDINSEITNTEIIESGEKVMIVHRTHVPMTLQYDTVKHENTSDGRVIEEIKRTQAGTLSKVRNIFRQRLKFQKKDRWKNNREEGNIDARNLWKIATRQNDTHVFEENNPKFINKITSAIFADLSGSMDKDTNAQKLRELTLFLSEGLRECYIRHEIVGAHSPVSNEMRKFDASGVYNRTKNSLETVVYKKFDDKENKGLDNMKVHCSDNSDSESLRIAADRLLKQRSKRRVIFICSDAKPYLSGANIGMMDAALIETIKWIRQSGIKIYHFSFNSDKGKDFYGADHINIESWDGMVQSLWKVLQ